MTRGLEVKPAPYLPYAYEISNYNHILALDAFIQGKIQVQDVSSMLVAEIANPAEGKLHYRYVCGTGAERVFMLVTDGRLWNCGCQRY